MRETFLRKIYLELAVIRKELQAMRHNLELSDHSFFTCNCNTNNLIKKDSENIKTMRGGT